MSDGPARKGAKSVTDDTASRGGRGGTVCNARVLAFCARRELARGLCGFVFWFWSPRPFPSYFFDPFTMGR